MICETKTERTVKSDIFLGFTVYILEEDRYLKSKETYSLQLTTSSNDFYHPHDLFPHKCSQSP